MDRRAPAPLQSPSTFPPRLLWLLLALTLVPSLHCPWPQLGLIFPRLAHGVNTGLTLILTHTQTCTHTRTQQWAALMLCCLWVQSYWNNETAENQNVHNDLFFYAHILKKNKRIQWSSQTGKRKPFEVMYREDGKQNLAPQRDYSKR